ncbi:MAG TPA: DUF3310 domain-containing protein [Flavobacteriales bacterium]|nr:DUF3310 domain-containing protein [Flavobacteriales bacterium]
MAREKIKTEDDAASAGELVHGFQDGVQFKPAYYKPVNHSELIHPEADVWDVVHAFDISNSMTSMALKYIIRAGKKTGNPASQDLTKAMECLQRAIHFSKSVGE